MKSSVVTVYGSPEVINIRICRIRSQVSGDQRRQHRMLEGWVHMHGATVRNLSHNVGDGMDDLLVRYDQRQRNSRI